MASHTSLVKTAITLPDRIFRAAERHARRARKSRSQLYADADESDPFVAAASRRVLEDSTSCHDVKPPPSTSSSRGACLSKDSGHREDGR